jgi:ribonucleoside-diphosphate reductase alpha chain
MESPTMTPASPEAPTAPPVTPPSGVEGQRQGFNSLAEARNGRPRTLSGVTKKIQTGHGPLYVTMNDDEFGPRECFVILGKPAARLLRSRTPLGV